MDYEYRPWPWPQIFVLGLKGLSAAWASASKACPSLTSLIVT